MKRLFEIILLLSIIGVCILYIFLYYTFNLAASDNWINIRYRKIILSRYYLKSLLKLRQIGDARFDYATANNFTTIILRTYIQSGQTLEPDTLNRVAEEIKRSLTGTKKIIIDKPRMLYDMNESADDAQLTELLQLYRPYISLPEKTFTVQIFVLNKYVPEPTYAGLVLNDTSIFIFTDAIRGVSDLQRTPQNAEVSTILHEYAHLLGAEHTDSYNCILLPEVENRTFFNRPAAIVDTYCPSDIEEMRKATSL